MSKRKNQERRAKLKVQKAALRLVKVLTPEQQVELAKALRAD